LEGDVLSSARCGGREERCDTGKRQRTATCLTFHVSPFSGVLGAFYDPAQVKRLVGKFPVFLMISDSFGTLNP